MAISLTTNRLTGLYSSLDTDSLIKTLMQIEQLQIDRQNRTKTTYEWKQTALNDINTDIQSFLNNYWSVLGSSSMRKSSAYVTFDVAMSGSNASAVTVTANSEASTGKVRIDQVVQLATAATAKSTGSEVDGVSKGISNSGQLSANNSATLGELDFANDIGFVDGKISFSINGKEFTFSSTDTLQSMITTVNSSDAGVTMSYSRLTDKISIASKETGKDSSVEIVNISGNAFGANSAFDIDEGVYDNGKNAIVKIEGITVEKSSNTFTIDGLTYTLNRETAVNEEDPITATITKNVDAAVDNIKSFIEGYNTLVGKLTTMMTERKSTSESKYTALTDEEKSSMTEEQIKAWEEIAKKGILYNDSGIQSMLRSLRNALYETVQSAGLSPAEIGLKTGTWSNGGIIELDEDVLRAALEKDATQVMNVFMASSDSSSGNGFINRINTIMNSYLKGSGTSSLESLESSISKINDKIDTMQTRMEEKIERLYEKYAALETALSKLQSQTDYLTSLLSSSN